MKNEETLLHPYSFPFIFCVDTHVFMCVHMCKSAFT